MESENNFLAASDYISNYINITNILSNWITKSIAVKSYFCYTKLIKQ